MDDEDERDDHEKLKDELGKIIKENSEYIEHELI